MPTMVQQIDEIPDNIGDWLADNAPGITPTAVRIVSRPVYRLFGSRDLPLLILAIRPVARWLVKRRVTQIEVDY